MTFKVSTQQILERSPTYFFSCDAFYARALYISLWLFIAGLSAEVRCYARKYWFRILYVHAHYVIICNDQLIIEANTNKIMDEGKQCLLSRGVSK